MEEMMSQPKVSIIMGIFNVADTLDDAIDSILQQTYQDWKMIMCDDGSTDETYQIAKKYAIRYPEKILLIKNEKNFGLNATLNHCLEYVDTEFTARMDGDDISLPERLQVEVDFLEKHPEYVLVSTPMIYFDEYGDFRIGKGNGSPDPRSFPQYSPFAHAPCMIRTSVIMELGGYSLDENKNRVEDWDLWIRLYQAGYKGYNLSEPLYKMRDDRNAFKRRTLKSRINEARVRLQAVKYLRLPVFYSVYALKPIIAYFLPSKIYMYLHKNR